MKYSLYVLFCFSLLFLINCKQNKSAEVYNLPAISENGINAVIEIPAGTNRKIEFNPATRQFETDQLDGKDRMVKFLPYPGNYGFIPSTYMDPKKGGDGDALDVLVLCESLETGTKIEVKLIAALLLEDNGEKDTKLIAIPTNPDLQTIAIKDFHAFMIEHHIVQQIVKDWFLNYKGLGQMKFIAWRDDLSAMREIKKWEKK